MLLVPWRQMDREAFATADLALVERVGSWAFWLYGLLYVFAGLALSTLWLTKSGSVTLGVMGMVLCILATGLFGLLAQALGAGMILLLGKIASSPPEGRTSLVAYLRYLRGPLLLIASLRSDPHCGLRLRARDDPLTLSRQSTAGARDIRRWDDVGGGGCARDQSSGRT